jgi:hypothetical protein
VVAVEGVLLVSELTFGGGFDVLIGSLYTNNAVVGDCCANYSVAEGYRR